MRLALDYAELSLESGQPEDAEHHLSKVLDALSSSHMDGMRERARLLHARAWRRPSARTTPSWSSSRSSTTRRSTA